MEFNLSSEKDFQRKYATRARIKPAFIVFLPLGIALIALFSNIFTGWSFLAWAMSSVGISILLEQISRDLGKRKEDNLFKQWGGKPSTILLSHQKSTLNRTTLHRYQATLFQLTKISFPTIDDEINNQKQAYLIYESYGDFLKEKTRDVNKFRLLFEESINYGFRRNLWGMKTIALCFLFLSSMMIVMKVYLTWEGITKVQPVDGVALIINALLLISWIFLITPDWIKVTAYQFCPVKRSKGLIECYHWSIHH